MLSVQPLNHCNGSSTSPPISSIRLNAKQRQAQAKCQLQLALDILNQPQHESTPRKVKIK